MFVEISRAEPALLESAEAGDELGVEAFRVCFQRVTQRFFRFDPFEPVNRREPSVASIAALLFVAVNSNLPLPEDLLANPMWSNVISHQSFQTALVEGRYKEAPRTLLSRWIQQPAGEMLAVQKLQIALQFQIKEALGIAWGLVKDGKTSNPYSMGCGIEGLGRLGGKPYAALLAPLLKKQGVVFQQQRMVNNKIEMRTIQVRNVALVWLVRLTGQDHAQYNMPEAKAQFQNLDRFPMGFGFVATGFSDDLKRDAALKKWEKWVEAHPLPAPPPKPDFRPAPPIRAPGSQRNAPGRASPWLAVRSERRKRRLTTPCSSDSHQPDTSKLKSCLRRAS